MATLKENPTLKDLQQYIKEVCKERGWDKNNHLEIFLLFTEEIGELAKAIRKRQGLYDEEVKANKFQLEEEFADVFSYLLDLANYFEVDLEKAFREKDKINSERKWD
jgi:NTP pyrophosphatase (non-canonical NTP hydrolase)